MPEPFVRPDVASFPAYLNGQTGPKMHEMPIAEARGMMAAMRHVADANGGEVALKHDLEIPGPAGTINARLYDNRPNWTAGLGK